MKNPGGAALRRSSWSLSDPDSEVDSSHGTEADPDAANGRHRMKSIKGKLLSWVTAMAAVALTAAPGLIGVNLGAADTNSTRGFRGPTEMEQFIDGVMAGQRESHHIVGAVVVVVMDGDLFFAKGYGPANLERNLPVDPSTTLFRIGSVTKLLTASAVMRLWEQDKLRLDENVSTTICAVCSVPATFPEPFALHTSWSIPPVLKMIDRALIPPSPSAVKPLVITLANELPARVRPPGALSVYSNHGTALAGLLRDAGSLQMYWEEYVEKNILDPLGMDHSTVWQPVRPELEPCLGRGLSPPERPVRGHRFRIRPHCSRRLRQRLRCRHGALHDRPARGRTRERTPYSSPRKRLG